MQVCSCPAAASLPTLPEMNCKEDFGQIQKIVFQRLKNGGKKNEFTTLASITLLESWQPLLVAEDSTKVVVTPFVEAPTHEGGDAMTFGSGNEVLGGVPRILGSNPSTMTFALRSYSQDVIAKLKELMCERELGVYLINESGQIGALVDKEVSTTFRPIPIQGFFVGDKTFGGFDNPDNNAMSFSFPAGYSDQFKIVVPEFNPLIEL